MTALDSAAPRRSGRLRRLARALVVLVVAAGLVGAGIVAGIRLAERQESGIGAASSIVPSIVPSAASSIASIGPSAAPSGPTAVLVGAGDIARCGSVHDVATAALVAKIPGIVFTTGDNAYETGTAAEYARCYEPTWGRFRDRTRPAIGNHDAYTANGAAYFAYFGAAAGAVPDGWYSYDAGTWHVIVLNSNCVSIGGCGDGSRQLTWLEADLAAHPAACTLAIWHHPRFSSGEHGNNKVTDPFWRVLYDAHIDLIVNGHDHDYERFAPQTPTGQPDPANGIREIIVGTGGKSLRAFRPTMAANSEVGSAQAYGVLRLDLAPGGYTWRFVPVPGEPFTDGGTTACH